MRISVTLLWLAVLLPLCGALFIPDYFAQGVLQIGFTLSLFGISYVCYIKARARIKSLRPKTRLEAAVINQQIRILSSFCGNISLFLVIGAILSPLLKDLVEHNLPNVDISYVVMMLALSFVFQFLALNVITNYKDEDVGDDLSEDSDRRL